jgi:glucose/arabinose dehydrogenase
MKRLSLSLVLAALVACTPGSTNTITTINNPTPSGTVSLEPVATGLDNPVYLTNAGSGKDLYVVEKTGKVKILENATTLRSTPFLDLAGQLDAGDPLDANGERGLLSIAFHPKYATNNFVYAYYTTQNGDLTISRFTVNPSTKVAANKLELLSIPHPRENHNGGQLQFGQDGFLYIGTGDGGGGGDPDRNGQNKQTLLGKILRIDVDKTDPGLAYAIPDGNPFKIAGGAQEVWAYGLRNPWRFSFDRSTGDLWIGDVGQDKFEEVDFTPKGSSAPRNYGWNTTEGKSCFGATTCDKTGIDLPVLDYGRSAGDTSITGGYVYRGTASPKIAGKYIYADFSSGRIWSLIKSGSDYVNTLEVDTADNISSFGQGADGELYVVALGGKVSRLVVK